MKKLILIRSYILEQYQIYNNIGKSISIGVIYRFSLVLINFITGFVISRELMEAGRGQFQLFLTSLIMFNLFLNLGFNQSAIYYAGKKPEKLNQFVSSNFFLNILSTLIIGITIVLFSFYFSFQSNSLKYLFILSYFFYSFSLLFRSFLIGQNHTIYSLKIDLYLRIGYFVYIFIMYYMKCLSVFNILIYVALEYLLFSIIAKRRSEINFFPLKLDLDFIKETFVFNAKSYIYAILITILSRGDQYLIKYFYNNYNVGLYSIGNTIIENMYVITGMVSTLYLPKLLSSDDLDKILKKSNKILIVLFIVSICMAVAVYFLAPYIVELYFKKINIEAVQSLRILLIGFVFWSLFIFISMIYLSIRFKKSLLFITLFCMALNLMLNYFYLPRYGIVAAAWASSFCYCLLFLMSYIDLFILKKNNFIKRTMEQ